MDQEGNILYFSQCPLTEDYRVDTEERTATTVDLNGVPATIFSLEDENRNCIVWHNDSYIFHIEGPVTKDEIILIAQNIKKDT